MFLYWEENQSLSEYQNVNTLVDSKKIVSTGVPILAMVKKHVREQVFSCLLKRGVVFVLILRHFGCFLPHHNGCFIAFIQSDS